MVLPTMRLSNTLVRVAQALMANPYGIHYGYSLANTTGLQTGSVYPTLHRLNRAELLTVEWEVIPAQGVGRPPRHIYKLTPQGRQTLRRLLTEAKRNPRFALLFA